ncbi:MAG: HD domain-containing protein [Bacilli bacterium]|nr:HD domain-containing protein [Bacilli bacterium]
MEKYLGIFKRYIDENYDLENPLVKLKYYHTLRVVDLMKDLVNRLGLSEDEKRLAIFIALFHDLGRFYEAKLNKQFSNVNFDHAYFSNFILFYEGFIKNFPIKEEEYEIIKKAIFYHNKIEIGRELNPEARLFAMYIRDVDKIDILKVISENHLEFNAIPSKKILTNYYKQESIDVHDIRSSSSDKIILYLSFYDQLYTPEAKEILNEKGYMEDFICSVKLNENEKINNYFYDLIDHYRRGNFYKKRKKR